MSDTPTFGRIHRSRAPSPSVSPWLTSPVVPGRLEPPCTIYLRRNVLRPAPGASPVVEYRIREHPILPVPDRDARGVLLERHALHGPRRRDHRLGALRQRHPRLRPPPQGRRAAGHLLRQRPVRAVHRHRRRPAGEVLHGAGQRRACAWRRSRAAGAARTCSGRCSCAPIQTVDVRVPDHRRRAGRAVGGHRAGPRRRPDAPRRRQAPPRRQARPADAQVLRLDRRLLRRHARHRHRHPARTRGPRSSRTSASG